MYRTNASQDRSLLLFGHDNKVVAYRRDNGEIAWSFEHAEAYGYYVDFVIVEGRAFVAVGHWLVAVDYATGRPLASTEFRSRVVRVMHDDPHLFAFGDEHVYCVDLQGRVLWERPHRLVTATTMPTFGFPGNVSHGFRDS
jgi:outer membrane protein assembly factor BamB